MAAADTSPRRNVIDEFKRLWKEVRAGSYFVKRGPILWANHDFNRGPRACAILIDQGTVLLSPNTMAVSFEVAARWSVNPADREMDEGLLDELLDDAEWVLRSVLDAVDAKSNHVVLSVGDDASFIEFNDPDLRIQGIVLTVGLTY